jgi:hypothetical protein
VAESDYGRALSLAQNNPEEFERLIKALDKVTVRPHAGQQTVLDSKARFKVMNCGRRWGKTVLAAKIIVSKSRKKNQMLWWVAPTYRIVKRGYDEVLRQLPPGVLEKPAPPSTNFDAGRPVVLQFKNGTKMEFYSAERPEGMLGAAVDYVVVDEAARMKAAIWEQTISPTLIDHLGGALMISTPRGRNWFYRVWLKGQDPKNREYDSWTFTTQDNPTLPDGEADRMAADMPRMEADQELYAKWLAAGSSVFLLDDRAYQDAAVFDNGLVEDYSPKGHHVVLGIDLARTNDYTVIYGARANDRRNVFFERFQDVAWEEQRRRIKRALRTLYRAGATGITLCVDEGNAGSVIVEDLEELGLDVIGVNFTTHKANMVRLLANDLERGRSFILKDTDYGLLEFENYMMDVTPGGRYTYSAPEGEHDDVVSAKMLQHHGLVNEGVPELTVITGDDSPHAGAQSGGSDQDPWDEEGDLDEAEYLDLLDEDSDLSDAQAAVAIGLPDPTRPPTPQELINRPDVWF